MKARNHSMLSFAHHHRLSALHGKNRRAQADDVHVRADVVGTAGTAKVPRWMWIEDDGGLAGNKTKTLWVQGALFDSSAASVDNYVLGARVHVVVRCDRLLGIEMRWHR